MNDYYYIGDMPVRVGGNGPPIVFCHGFTPPPECRALAAGIPDAQLELIPAAAHFPMLEAPERFSAILRHFVNRTAL